MARDARRAGSGDRVVVARSQWPAVPGPRETAHRLSIGQPESLDLALGVCDVVDLDRLDDRPGQMREVVLTRRVDVLGAREAQRREEIPRGIGAAGRRPLIVERRTARRWPASPRRTVGRASGKTVSTTRRAGHIARQAPAASANGGATDIRSRSGAPTRKRSSSRPGDRPARGTPPTRSASRRHSGARSRVRGRREDLVGLEGIERGRQIAGEPREPASLGVGVREVPDVDPGLGRR